MSELPHSLRACPVFFNAFDFFTVNDPQASAPLLLMGCLRLLHCFIQRLSFAGILDWCLLLAPIPRAANIQNSRCASRASPSFGAPLSWSPMIRFMSFSCLFFATHKLIERRLMFSVQFVVYLPLLHWVLRLHGRTPSPVCFFSFISPLLLKCRHLRTASDHPLLLKLGSFG